MKPAITTLDAAGLRAAALVLRDVLAATSSLTDAAAVRAMMEREATIAEAIVANADAEGEDAQAGLADAVAEHLAQAGPSSARATRVAPSAPAPASRQPHRTRWSERQRELQRERMRQRMAGQAIWTPERLALMHREFPTADLRTLLERVNALPGPAVASVDAMRQRAKADGVKRDPARLRQSRRESMLRANAAKEALAADETARRYTPNEQDQLRDRCRERLAREGLTQREAAWQAGIAEGSITPWLAGKSASGIARKIEEWLDGAPTPPPAPHGVKASPAPEDGSPPDWDDEAQAEARRMLAAGRGARDLAQWFGGSLPWWQAWCERERAENGA
jgi:transcriptional regulator with XRE-family HTH domain